MAPLLLGSRKAVVELVRGRLINALTHVDDDVLLFRTPRFEPLPDDVELRRLRVCCLGPYLNTQSQQRTPTPSQPAPEPPPPLFTLGAKKPATNCCGHAESATGVCATTPRGQCSHTWRPAGVATPIPEKRSESSSVGLTRLSISPKNIRL